MSMLNDMNKVFSENPVSLDMRRSKFTMNQTHKTTLSEGDLVPIYLREVLPGDTFSVDTSFLIRMATPIFPVMDNAFIDIYYFYVPNRIVWQHWKEFMGENTSAPWAQTIQYSVPQLKFGSALGNKWTDKDGHVGYGPMQNSVMNYFGIPTSILPASYTGPNGPVYPELSVSDLPNRAYRLIWNEFFRDQNLQSPVSVYLDDSTRDYSDSADPSVLPTSDYGGRPLKVNKFHDYFTSCLPAPQKGPAVTIGFPERFVPVNAQFDKQVFGSVSDVNPLTWAHGTLNLGEETFNWSNSSLTGVSYVELDSNTTTHQRSTASTSELGDYITPNNLYADFNGINLTSVNVLREAFAVQRLYEAFARGGTRYREMLKSIFGVTAPDYRVQVPEYLGGDRIPINMDQVLQTSSTDSTSPQGNTAGFSLTTNVEHSFTKSFVEHGMVIGLACIRVEHTYAQGIEPYWFRKNLFDFYFPQFANLSEQPVYKKYLCATGFSEYDDTVFGYQEAWADYRFAPNRLSGAFSPLVFDDGDGNITYQNSSLADAWTYNDFYSLSFNDTTGKPVFTDLPTLSAGWMSEDNTNVGQTIAVPNEPQFIADFRFDVTAVRPMPVRSIPGLIDHH